MVRDTPEKLSDEQEAKTHLTCATEMTRERRHTENISSNNGVRERITTPPSSAAQLLPACCVLSEQSGNV